MVSVLRPGQRILQIPGYGVSTSRRAVSSGANGLLNSLIAYWPLNEASGNALDAHTNGLTLTDTNTVTNAAGKVYAMARQYTRANSEYHNRADDTSLSLGSDSDFSLAAWVYFDTVGNDTKLIVNKRLASTGATTEYQVGYLGTDFGGPNRLRFSVGNGTSSAGISATTLGLPATSTWYFIVAWHDAVSDTINIQVNGGAVDSTAWAGGTQNGTAPTRVGAEAWESTPALGMDGRIGPVAMWKSAAGLGGVLTAAQRTALWNAGAGLPYASFTV